VVRVEEHDGKLIVLARVQLIGIFHTPVYEVVVGEHLPSDPKVYVPTQAPPMKSYRDLQIENAEAMSAKP
jgi:hypothetical protein